MLLISSDGHAHLVPKPVPSSRFAVPWRGELPQSAPTVCMTYLAGTGPRTRFWERNA